MAKLYCTTLDRVPLAAVPTPVVGMRRVTEAVAQMVVNTLMGTALAFGNWLLAEDKNSNNIYHGGTETRRAARPSSGR